MTRARTLAVQVSLIATAFALGLAVRTWRQRRVSPAAAAPAISLLEKATSPAAEQPVQEITLTNLRAVERRRVQAQIASPHTPTDERARLTLALFRGVHSADDAALLFETMLRDPDATDREHNHLVAALLLWAKYDTAAALDAVTRIGYFDVRDDAAGSVLSEWAERDFPAALAYLKKQTGGPVSINGPRILCGVLAEKDPQFAVTTMIAEGWVDQWDNRNGAAFRTLQTWLGKDPDAAWSFVLNHPGPERESLLLRLGTAGMTHDRQGTWTRLTDPATRSSDNVLQAALHDWRDSDPSAALKATLPLPPGDFQNKMLTDTALNPARLPEFSSSDGMANLLNEIPAGPPRDAFLRGLTEHAGDQKDFDKAAAYANQIQDPTLHTDALRQLGPVWCAADAEAASIWLAGQPPSLGRDLVARALAREIIKEDPESALTWAATMQDAPRREAVVRELLEKWQTQDPAAAQAWSDRANPPEPSQ